MSEPATQPPKRMGRIAFCVLGFSFLNLAMVCAVSYVIYVISEEWWVGTFLTFAPRTPWLIPTLVLILASLIWHRASIKFNLVSLLIVLVPIMGLSIPFERWLSRPVRTPDDTELKIVSCNVQVYQPDFDKVLSEIATIKPDIIAFQEAGFPDPSMDELCPDWHVVHHGLFYVTSRYPLKHLSDIVVKEFGGRLAGMLIEVDTPAGPILLADVHQMTVRRGLMALNSQTLVDGAGIETLESCIKERSAESENIRAALNAGRNDLPLIVCGDFNTPTCSSQFQTNWGDLRNSYDSAGFGYGYTSPCNGTAFWPDDLPWVRIDHILCSDEFGILGSRVGQSNGSDHRLTTATVVIKPPSKDSKPKPR